MAKSKLVGFVSAVSLTLSAANIAHAAAPPVPTVSPAASRYVIYFSPHDEADTFLLDTFTGREWQEIENDKTHAMFFGEVSVRGISQRPTSY